MIEIKDLKKIYNQNKTNELEALKGISLTIGAGEMVSIMGKSAAGKSTLLNILGLVDNFQAGSFEFQEQSVGQLKDREKAKLRAKEIGFILQDFGLIEQETVYENVKVPLFFDDTAWKDIKGKIRTALDAVGISDLQGRKVHQLSGGQKQRVAIARAIVNNPALILCDEPTGSLDENTAGQIMEVFLDLWKRGHTIIIVTHDPGIAAWCPRQIQLEGGQIVSDQVREEAKSESNVLRNRFEKN